MLDGIILGTWKLEYPSIYIMYAFLSKWHIKYFEMMQIKCSPLENLSEGDLWKDLTARITWTRPMQGFEGDESNFSPADKSIHHWRPNWNISINASWVQFRGWWVLKTDMEWNLSNRKTLAAVYACLLSRRPNESAAVLLETDKIGNWTFKKHEFKWFNRRIQKEGTTSSSLYL